MFNNDIGLPPQKDQSLVIQEVNDVSFAHEKWIRRIDNFTRDIIKFKYYNEKLPDASKAAELTFDNAIITYSREGIYNNVKRRDLSNIQFLNSPNDLDFEISGTYQMIYHLNIVIQVVNLLIGVISQRDILKFIMLKMMNNM